MVDMGEYIIYAGPDGLTAVQGATATVITQNIITPEQWQSDYYPSTITGFKWQGRYVGYYNTGSGYGGFIFDPREQANAFVDLDASALIRGGFTDPDDNELYNYIKVLCSDSSLRDLLSRNARSLFKEKYKSSVVYSDFVKSIYKVASLKQ